MAGFSGLTFAAVPVVVNTGSDAAPVYALNTALVAGTTVIAGLFDPISTQRIFNPQAEGNPVVTGDSYATWLPVLNTISDASVLDNYWVSIPGQSAATVGKPGQVKITLKSAAANVVEASSVMAFWVSPQAFVITCSAGTF